MDTHDQATPQATTTERGLMARPTSPSAAHAAETGRRAVELRARRLTFDQIAEAMGYSDRGTARKAYLRGLEAIRKDSPEAATMRVAESEYLDNLRDKIAPLVEAGEWGAIDRAVKISERYSKLNGLDLNDARVAGALEAGAVAQLAASSQLHAGIIAAMGKIGMPLEMQDQLIEALNEWLAQQSQPEQDEEGPVSDELVIITGEVENR